MSMFIRTRHVGAYDYSEACESYRKDGKPTQRVIARWPAGRSLADALDCCEVEIITCKLWLYTHELLAAWQPIRLSDTPCDPGVRRNIRAARYGAAGYRRRLARAQRRLPGLRKAARAMGITVRSGKLPARVMLSTEELDGWREDLEAAKAAIQLEMQRRHRREAARARSFREWEQEQIRQRRQLLGVIRDRGSAVRGT
jgi:hypothetical protein